jgi:hypothetical protein
MSVAGRKAAAVQFRVAELRPIGPTGPGRLLEVKWLRDIFRVFVALRQAQHAATAPERTATRP